jgi:polyisoprenoid-binding protein YceI
MNAKHRQSTWIGLALLVTVLTGAMPVLAASYDIDPAHSSVNFQVKHLAISKVNGSFGTFSGTFSFVEGEPASWQAAAGIEITSIDTDNQDRDDHLRGPDFFDAAQFPTMTFKAAGVKMSSASEGELTGDLTLHGVTKPVTLALEFLGTATDPWGNERAGFSLNGKIDRKDWGLTWNKALETGGLVVGDEIKISLEIEGIRAK